MKNKLKFKKKFNLTENQFNGTEQIDRCLYLNSLTSIPEGFNPIVGGDFDLRSLTSIPEGFNPTVGGGLYLSNLTSIPKGFNPTVGGYLYLSNLTSIPKGFNPTVGGGLYLRSLTSIPKGFNPIVGGDFDLRSLTSIPEDFNPTVGGYLDLSNLTSIPEGFNPTVGGGLGLSNLTSIPKGFNPTVGGYLDLSNLTSIPGGLGNKEIGMLSWENGKYIQVDGIFSEVVNKKKNIYVVKSIGKPEISYIVSDGKGTWSHGVTIKQAKADLIYKFTNIDVSKLKELDINNKMEFSQAVSCYRSITKSCISGTKRFIEIHDIDNSKKYSVLDVIRITKENNGYGNETFSRFFENS